jgi:1-acyl-sn-glycerol-3-phosphate acyltransferase
MIIKRQYTAGKTGSYRRAHVNNFLNFIGKTVLKILGWKIKNPMPDIKKCVIVVAYHTSNIDFLIGLMISFAIRIEPYWLVKNDYLKWPFKPFALYLGGIPVFRDSKNNLVDQIAKYFADNEFFHLALAPEGTRKKKEFWKSGFYHIARKAEVPIICAYLDYKEKICSFSPPFKLSGIIKADMDYIRQFYSGVTARIPSNAGNIILREELS